MLLHKAQILVKTVAGWVTVAIPVKLSTRKHRLLTWTDMMVTLCEYKIGVYNLGAVDN
ncbi:hypothetical protein ACWJJH_18425 [Endozoicomonadaceae bacterium StTr2]